MENVLAGGTEDPMPYCVAAGKLELLTQFLIQNGKLEDAFLIAVAGNEGNFSLSPRKKLHRNNSSMLSGGGENTR